MERRVRIRHQYVGAHIIWVLIKHQLGTILGVLELVRGHKYVAKFDMRSKILRLKVNRAVELLEASGPDSSPQVAVSQFFMRLGKLWINLDRKSTRLNSSHL